VTTGLWKLAAFGVVGGVLLVLALAEAGRRGDARGVLTGVFLGWLLPGAGHVWHGHVRRGLLLFALVGGLFAAGCVLTGGRVVTFDENPFYYIGQTGSGLTLGVQAWLSANGGPPRSVDYLPLVDPGLLYMSIAGLLNLLLVLNLFDLRKPAPAGEAKSAT
jgi:hypothetical protein